MPPPVSLDALTATDSIAFDFEDYIATERGISLSLERVPVCRNHLRGGCSLGNACPLRHPAPGKRVVCKHWLRGLCKKGDACEFLHEYNMNKMPECWFFAKYGECSNPDCVYLHIDPSVKRRECPWFARGFCKHGPHCKHRHVKKVPCLLYLAGFCPDGPNCANGHPKFEVSTVDDDEFADAALPPGGSAANPTGGPRGFGNHNGAFDHIVCFKCGRKGHFANHCPLRAQHHQRQF
ncbi:hypothetical protein AMAG_01018 [Allomyces macrogynus ATCC 38327]|uniref:mRNA 3'-end-processing protein n=1 Tax=Allomyces macrogynus (strain ATCC 38327) TaxID=578462 RepID=A0A0L0RXM6_ALLM3|nr:hypothetical protein AMAG_01018 [Allomyces macrogynus ATCC 38327]|eukprot:KNE55083.1 hypothetical protein AMAG_01018 [Allomyces macrogynus ATCC 38327]